MPIPHPCADPPTIPTPFGGRQRGRSSLSVRHQCAAIRHCKVPLLFGHEYDPFPWMPDTHPPAPVDCVMRRIHPEAAALRGEPFQWHLPYHANPAPTGRALRSSVQGADVPIRFPFPTAASSVRSVMLLPPTGTIAFPPIAIPSHPAQAAVQ